MCKHPGYKDNLYKTDQDEAFRINIPALTLNEAKKRICQPRLTYPLLLSQTDHWIWVYISTCLLALFKACCISIIHSHSPHQENRTNCHQSNVCTHRTYPIL